MSGILDKAKDAVKGGSSGGSGGSGGSAGNSATTKGVDMATDKAGLGDKYDKQISEQVDKQMQGGKK